MPPLLAKVKRWLDLHPVVYPIGVEVVFAVYAGGEFLDGYVVDGESVSSTAVYPYYNIAVSGSPTISCKPTSAGRSVCAKKWLSHKSVPRRIGRHVKHDAQPLVCL